MKREAKEEGWLNPKKDSKKNEVKSQKIWKKVIKSPKKEKMMKKVEKK